MAAHGFVGRLGVVPAAQEETQGTLSTPVVHGSDGHSLGEQGACGPELRLGAPTGEHIPHELGRDSPPLERSRDPLLAPAVESSPIFDETAREAGVVEVPGGGDLGQRPVGGGGLDAPPLEECLQLGDRVIASGERPPGERERPPVVRGFVVLGGHPRCRPRSAQAAWRTDTSALESPSTSFGAAEAEGSPFWLDAPAPTLSTGPVRRSTPTAS